MGDDGAVPGPRLTSLAGAVAALGLVVLAAGCSSEEAGAPPALTATSIDAEETGTPVQTVEVLTTIPHRPSAWTQGLVWAGDGRLYESTGLLGQSTLATIDLATGDAGDITAVDPALYAEGLALVGDELIQLTWQDGVAPIYDAATFERTGEFTYDGEGWGLCHDGDRLVMSDGSADLTFRDPATFDETGSVTVTLDGDEVGELNELECVGDRVYANVWHTDTILEIDAASGEVLTVVDASALAAQLDPPAAGTEAVLNGIAHDPHTDTFWLTGKLWPQMFQVRFVDA
jgi:glutaminyl-peptide cyclotransferase